MPRPDFAQVYEQLPGESDIVESGNDSAFARLVRLSDWIVRPYAWYRSGCCEYRAGCDRHREARDVAPRRRRRRRYVFAAAGGVDAACLRDTVRVAGVRTGDVRTDRR